MFDLIWSMEDVVDPIPLKVEKPNNFTRRDEELQDVPWKKSPRKYKTSLESIKELDIEGDNDIPMMPTNIRVNTLNSQRGLISNPKLPINLNKPKKIDVVYIEFRKKSEFDDWERRHSSMGSEFSSGPLTFDDFLPYPEIEATTTRHDRNELFASEVKTKNGKLVPKKSLTITNSLNNVSSNVSDLPSI
jgi:hypothetical protein